MCDEYTRTIAPAAETLNLERLPSAEREMKSAESRRRKDHTLDWSTARARRASWDWKSGPAKLHYLWGLGAFGEPHILRFLERFWRYMPQFATVGLVGGFSGRRREWRP